MHVIEMSHDDYRKPNGKYNIVASTKSDGLIEFEAEWIEKFNKKN